MSIHPTKSGKVEVRWREGTRNRSRTFDRKKDAVAFDAKVRRSSQLGEAVPQRTGSDTLDEVFAHFLANKHGLSKRTKTLYKQLYISHIHPFLGYVPVRQLEDEERLENWQTGRLAAGAGVEAIAKSRKLLFQVFKAQAKRGKMGRNPMLLVDAPTLEGAYKAPVTPEKVQALRQHFLEQERLGDAVLVQLWGVEGLRVGEALALAPDDVVRAEALWIGHSLEDDGTRKGTKNGKEGLVPMCEPVRDDFMVFRRERGAAKLIYGRASDGEGWTKSDRNNWNRRYFKPACEAVGIPGTTPRDLRIAAASLHVIEGKRPTEIAETFRHSLATSIKVYQRFMKEHEGQPNRPRGEIVLEARAKLRTLAEHGDDKERLIAAKAQTTNGEDSA